MNSNQTREPIELFRLYLKRETNLKPNSIDAYIYDVRKFRTFLSRRDISIHDATAEDVQAFLYRHSRETSPRSLARSLTALRRFHDVLLQVGVIVEHPSRDIAMPVTIRREPEVLSRHEVQACLNAFRDDDPLHARNKMICELIYSRALRSSELCRIRVQDLELDTGKLLVRGDGEKSRTQELTPADLERLRTYMKDSRPRIAPSPGEYLFPSRSGGQLHRKSVWRMLRKHLEHSNLDFEVTPRVLRHSRAVHLLREGTSIHAVRALLGNVDAATMRRYVRLARKET